MKIATLQAMRLGKRASAARPLVKMPAKAPSPTASRSPQGRGFSQLKRVTVWVFENGVHRWASKDCRRPWGDRESQSFALRQPAEELWQGRFFDRALRTVKEYGETVEYIHLNPVRRGLVGHLGQWKWSGYHEYAGATPVEQQTRCGLVIDRVQLPTDANRRI